jgi:putative sterol carrier protein
MKRYATFKPLTGRSHDDIGGSLRRMASALSKARERGRIHLRLAGATGESVWTVALGAKAPKVTAKAEGRPTVEIVTREETWARIADGVLSPLEAFVTGKLRLRGDAALAKRLVRTLSGNEGETEICG